MQVGKAGRVPQGVLEQISLSKEHLWKLKIWRESLLTVHAADLWKSS